MSAFIVSTDCVNVIINAAIVAGMAKPAAANDLGKAFFAMNTAAVNDLYAARHGRQRAPRFTHVPAAPEAFNASAALKSLRAYTYQACDAHAWDGSLAKMACTALEAWLVSKGADPKSAAYEAAPWG